MALQRLREGAERAKIELSNVTQTEINLPFITADASGPKHLVMPLSRSKLEQLVADLVQRSVGPCRQAMKDATDKGAGEVDEVVLVGGMTRMPAVQKAVVTCSARRRTRGSTRTRSSRSGRPYRRACCRATCRTCCCWT